jgi:hypothetical protein
MAVSSRGARLRGSENAHAESRDAAFRRMGSLVLVTLLVVLTVASDLGDRALGADCSFLAETLREVTALNARFGTPSTQAAVAKAQNDYNACLGSNANPVPPPAPVPAPVAPVVAPVEVPDEVPLAPAAPPEPRVFGPHQYQFPPAGAPARTIINPSYYRGQTAIGQARSGPLAASEDGSVLIGSGQIKLGWQLYGQTNMSEKDAAALYAQRSAAVIADLERQKAAADATAARYASQQQFFEAAEKAQKIEGLMNVLRAENTELSEERKALLNETISSAGWAVLETAALPGAAVAHLALDAAALRLELRAKAASGERFDTVDHAAILGLAFDADVVWAEQGTRHIDALAPFAPAVERFADRLTIAKVGVNLMLFEMADHQLQQSDLAIQHPTEALRDHAALLASGEAAARQTSSELARQIEARKKDLEFVQRSLTP